MMRKSEIQQPVISGRVILSDWQRIQLKIKYGLDRVLSVILIILSSPLLFAIAVAIKLDDGGPVFFRQDRLGLYADQFGIWKFRSMFTNADRYLDQRGQVTGNRITSVGRILRATSLDELPQLFNILAGQMSFIGPRPVVPEHLDRYSARQKLRFLVKPGVTGLAQINGRNTLKWSRRLEFDLQYIHDYSLYRDLIIVFRTIGVVFTSTGVVLDRNPADVDDLDPPARTETLPTEIDRSDS